MLYECDRVKWLWSDLFQCFKNNLILPTLHYRLPFLGFLITQTMTPFLKTINALAIRFY